MKYEIKNGSVFLNGNSILDEINFDITEKSHIGVVGKNGSGKTTLLKSLINNEMLDEGIEETSLFINKIGNFSIGYLEQVTFDNENTTLFEEIKKSFQEIIDLEKKIDTLVKKMETNSSLKFINEYTTCLERYETLGGYTYQKEYEIMLKKFGFTEEDKCKKISSFSGGERTKIAFLKLLLKKPDILFLDEPTNHLDIEAIVWLENYLKNYKKAFVVVSHDRMFLNNIANTIYNISNKRVIKYVGNYEDFERIRKENYEKNVKNYDLQQKEIKRLRTLYEKFRYKPSKASMALSQLRRIERMEKIDKPLRISEKTFKTNLNTMEPSGKTVCTLKNLEVGFTVPFFTLNLEILNGEKIGVIGANGSGKSTLLKTIFGILKPLHGNVSFGYHVRIGYFDQSLKMNQEEHTILEEFKSAFPNCLDNEARNALGAFLFTGEETNKKVSVLSGGEKVRLQLCKILYNKPNFLLLDEPTNHLDLVGKEQLESILQCYKGTILFVSHDRYFVKKIASKLIVFGETGASIFPYGYEEYVNKKKEKEIEIPKTNKIEKNTEKKSNPFASLKKIENELEKLEKEKKLTLEEMYKKENFLDYIKQNEMQKNLNQIEEKLKLLEKNWEELTELENKN